MFVYLAKKDSPKIIPEIKNNIFFGCFLLEYRKRVIPIINNEQPKFSEEVLAWKYG